MNSMRFRRALACLAAVLAGFTARAQDCSRPIAGGLSWWPGDGSATDLIGPNPGTLVGGAGFGPGWVGPGFTFDGMDDHVAVPFHSSYDFLPEGTFAIALWVNVAEGPGGGDRALVVKSPPSGAWDWGLYLTQDNTFMAGANSRAVVTSRTVAVPGGRYPLGVT